MNRVKVLSTINSIYNGIIAVLVIVVTVFFALLGKSVLSKPDTSSGEVFASVFTYIVAIAGALFGIACIVSCLIGVVAKNKARKVKDDKSAFFKAYYRDSVVKLGINGFTAVGAVSSVVDFLNKGEFAKVSVAMIIILFAGLAIWQFLEVLVGTKKES